MIRHNLPGLLAVVIGLICFQAAPARSLEIQRVISPGGIEAWLIEDHKIPVIAVQFSFEGGSGVESADKQGLACMTASLLDEGAGELDSQAFARRLQDEAISVDFNTNSDSFKGSLKTLSWNQDSAFELMALALTRPRFDAEAVERIRDAIISAIRQEQGDPNKVAQHAFYAALLPDHPYGRNELGTVESVAALSEADLRSFVNRQFARDRLLVAVTGDIRPDQLGPALDRLFGGLPATAGAVDIPEIAQHRTGETITVTMPIGQTVFMLGQQGIKRNDPDWFPAYIMNYVLGAGGFSSRLTEEVREKRGLTYGVYSHLVTYDHAALIMVGGSTVNAKAGETLALIKQEWTRMAEGGVTEKELANAKTYLTGSFPLQFTSARAIADIVLQVRRDRLGQDYFKRRDGLIEAVTSDDVKRVAKRLLNAATLTTVMVGQPNFADNSPTRPVSNTP
ncbi:MAG: pitrilysin family protein [Rhodospirillaceae bacterium]